MNETTALRFRRSEKCGSNACVEVAYTYEGVAVRDSKDPAPHLYFDKAGWISWLTWLKADGH